MTWAEEEFGGADLGDKRLNKRLVRLADRLGEQPSASIPEACRGSAEMHAAYRFLGRETQDWRELMQPHWDASARRMQAHPVVLCIQDTTELDFEGKATRGLGPLSYEAQRGMYVHPTYAVTPAREPLGVIDAWMWARAFKEGKAPREGIVESLRWLEGYARVAEQAQTMPETRLVYVADREADIVALMRRARDLGTPADWLIRSQHDRSLGKGAPKLSAALAASPVLGEVQFQMASRPGQAARTVRQEIRVLCQALPDGEGGSVTVSVVLASEVDAPRGVTPVQWRLLSNRQAATLEEAIMLIDWYRTRWEVEEAFKTLKHRLHLEGFSGDLPHAVEQEIHAKVLMANIAQALSQAAFEQVPEERQAHYRVNHAVAFKHLPRLLQMWLDPLHRSLNAAVNDLIMLLARTLEWFRPGRSYPRKHAQGGARRPRQAYR